MPVTFALLRPSMRYALCALLFWGVLMAAQAQQGAAPAVRARPPASAASAAASTPTPGAKPAASASAASGTGAAASAASAALPAVSPKQMGDMVREALGTRVAPKEELTLIINGQPVATAADGKSTPGQAAASRSPGARNIYVSPRNPVDNPRRARARPAAPPKPPVPWAYAGEGGPAHWGQLRPDYALCATGKRQSPIAIHEDMTLQGPAEPIQFRYTPSQGSVVNTGHTIQVDVQGDNTLTVRGTTYQLQELHFHSPAEELINDRRYPLVAHLVHKSEAGQLAVLALLMDIGEPNPLLEKIWTHMPLDKGDRVRFPSALVNLNAMLPADQRYYQYMGSLSTPPCTEGVLRLILKQPIAISPAQLRLFTQLYPNNARPIQATYDRPVREGM